MTTDKISADLTSQIRNVSGMKRVQVIVALDPEPLEAGRNSETRAQKINKLKAHFQMGFDKVNDVLNRNGGKVIDGAWINHTIHAEVPLSALDTLSDLQEVTAIEEPRRLAADMGK